LSKQRPSPPSAHRPSPAELRASLLLPVAITLAVWLVGMLVFVLLPEQFTAVISLAIGASLLVFFLFWTRRADARTRLTAVLLALPALAGVTWGVVSGAMRYTLLGVGLTLLLLTAQRILNTPFSYRVAYGRFRAGDTERALELINKSIAARPDFWQSYQLRALIYLAHLNFQHAEREGLHALRLRPDAHPLYNTLGQIYLAHMRFAEAADAYTAARQLAPDYALYWYHLGLSYYRLGQYQEAAESLAAATRGALPLVEYDLQAHYYLGRSLEALGEEELAAQAFQAMAHFADGLAPLQAQLASQPPFPHLELLTADSADIEYRLHQ
jgi:tetratricopeptide (TPR) repeat protein